MSFPLNNACVHCGDASGEFILDYQTGDYICSKCGAVQPGPVICTGKDWTEFDDDRENGITNARAEALDHDFASLSTTISATNFGSFASSQTARTLSKYARMDADRNEIHLKEAFAKVNELSEQLQLPSLIRNTAKEIIKNFEKSRDKQIKGLRKEPFIVAVLLIASKLEMGGGRTLKGFSRTLNIDEKEIKRFYKILLRERASIYDKLSVTGPTQRKSIIDEVKELIESFCNKLQQPFQVVKQAKEVAVKSIAALEGKRPSSVAAAAILFILTLMNASPKQQELAEVAGISTNTLRNVFKELTKNIDDIPKVPDMKATVIAANYVAVQ